MELFAYLFFAYRTVKMKLLQMNLQFDLAYGTMKSEKKKSKHLRKKEVAIMKKSIRVLSWILIAVFCLSAFACTPTENATDTGTAPAGTTEQTTTPFPDTNPAPSPNPNPDGNGTSALGIKLLTPASNEAVRLVNNTVFGWTDGYQFPTTDFDEYYLHQDLYYPNPVTLSFEVSKPADYYRLAISRNSDMTDSEQYLLNAPSLTLEHLFTGSEYYWQVDAVYADMTLRSDVCSFRTEAGPRTVRIDGVSNTRDIGGWKTETGDTVKQGLVYRGGQLEGITEAGKDTFLNVLGIRTDLDVRTALGADAKSPVSNNINYESFTGRYYVGSHGIDTAEGKAIMADELRVFANPDNYPIYIHCSLGRDRTGTLVMLINGLLGVEKNDLAMDYELSVFSVSGTYDNLQKSGFVSNFNSIYDYISSHYQGDRFSDKVENYMLDIGLTAKEIATIKYMMLENAEQEAANSKKEIPYGENDPAVQVYQYTKFDMMTEEEATRAGVPEGFSGYVLALTHDAGNAGIVMDLAEQKVVAAAVESITFRVWCPANIKEVRITANAGKSWLMRYVPAAKEQWIDITLKEGVDFFADHHTMKSLFGDDGYIKPVNLGFRYTTYTETTAYIDSITVNYREPDTAAPILTYTGQTEFNLPAGSSISINATAYDAYEDRVIEVEKLFPKELFDANGKLRRGDYICILQATDLSGNRAEIKLTLHVGEADTEAPVIHFAADSISVAPGTLNKLQITVTDNYEGVMTSVLWSDGTFDSFGRFTSGTHTLTVTAVDLSDNRTVKTISVIVSDNAVNSNVISSAPSIP